MKGKSVSEERTAGSEGDQRDQKDQEDQKDQYGAAVPPCQTRCATVPPRTTTIVRPQTSNSLDRSRLHAERDDAIASRPRASARRAGCGTPYPAHSACALRSIALPICGQAVSSYSGRDSGGRAGPRLTAASPRATSTSRCRNFRHTVDPGGGEQRQSARDAGQGGERGSVRESPRGSREGARSYTGDNRRGSHEGAVHGLEAGRGSSWKDG